MFRKLSRLALFGSVAAPLLAISFHYGRASVFIPDGDAKAEYYRGIYAVCVGQMGDIDFCLKAVGHMVNLGFYEAPDPGFEWPLPNPDVPSS